MTKTNEEHLSKYAKKKIANVEEVANDNVKEGDVINFNNKHKSKALPEITNKYPKHIIDLVILVKQNAEIRRFTSIGIINYLLQKGEIKGKSKYVSFKWNKFAVKSDGLIREFSYAEPFFIKCLIASFTSFSASAQKIINTFCDKELDKNINEDITNEEIEKIVESNEEYQNNKNTTNEVVE